MSEAVVLEPSRAQAAADVAERVVASLATVVHAPAETLRLPLLCLLARGHVLVEDVPGVGKTSLAKAIARSVGGTWRRIQFTPDLLPSDVVGVTVWRGKAPILTGNFDVNRVYRLPSGGLSTNWEVSVTGQREVNAVEMASSPQELQGG